MKILPPILILGVAVFLITFSIVNLVIERNPEASAELIRYKDPYLLGIDPDDLARAQVLDVNYDFTPIQLFGNGLYTTALFSLFATLPGFIIFLTIIGVWRKLNLFWLFIIVFMSFISFGPLFVILKNIPGGLDMKHFELVYNEVFGNFISIFIGIIFLFFLINKFGFTNNYKYLWSFFFIALAIFGVSVFNVYAGSKKIEYEYIRDVKCGNLLYGVIRQSQLTPIGKLMTEWSTFSFDYYLSESDLQSLLDNYGDRCKFLIQDLFSRLRQRVLSFPAFAIYQSYIGDEEQNFILWVAAHKKR